MDYLDCKYSINTLIRNALPTPLDTLSYVSSGAGQTYDFSTFYTQTIPAATCSYICTLTDQPCGSILTGTEIS